MKFSTCTLNLLYFLVISAAIAANGLLMTPNGHKYHHFPYWMRLGNIKSDTALGLKTRKYFGQKEVGFV
jgi:hypothetical protein